MKRLLIVSLAAMMHVAAMTAQVKLYIEDLQLETGQSATARLVLDNTEPVTALQVDITMPEGLTIAGGQDGQPPFALTDRKAPDHTLTSAPLSSGAVRVMVGSPSNAVLAGGEGAVVTFEVAAAEELPAGEYAITLANAKAFGPEGERFDIADGQATVTVTEPVPEPPLTLVRRMVRLPIGSQVRLEPTDELEVEWSSEDETIATVAADGTVTAVAPGMVAIEVTSAGGQKAWCAVFCYLPGDENEDNTVDVGDVNTVLEIILNNH